MFIEIECAFIESGTTEDFQVNVSPHFMLSYVLYLLYSDRHFTVVMYRNTSSIPERCPQQQEMS